MNILKVTPEVLIAKANLLEQRAKEIADIVRKIIALIDSISAKTWSGDANKAYRRKVDQLRDDAARIEKTLKEGAIALKKIAAEYKAAEAAIVGQANHLASDIF